MNYDVKMKNKKSFTLADNEDIKNLEAFGMAVERNGTEVTVPEQVFTVNLMKFRMYLDEYNRAHREAVLTFVTEGIMLYNLVKC